MPTLNELKEQMATTGSLGEFANALQQIATIRMMKLRDKVLASRPFVEAANEMMSELVSLRNQMRVSDLVKLEKKHGQVAPLTNTKSALIVVTSNPGLTGLYNIEIFKKVEKVLETEQGSDFFVIGKKGQEYFGSPRFKMRAFPYEVPENFGIEDLTRLIGLFELYGRITLVYSRYLNSALREVVAVSVVTPVAAGEEKSEEEIKSQGRFIYEPDIFDLIDSISKKLRAALFQQQLLDARLAQNSSQMIGMKTASDNATSLTADLRMEYNKQRRKMIDKKIGEVFAGSALW